MKIHDCQQGSAEWIGLRLGRPTASEFDKIITPTGKLSSQSRAYAHRLVAEHLLGYQVHDIGGLPWIERGKQLEADAVRDYEFLTDQETIAVGFITTDDGRYGASPDRMVPASGGLVEIKCPAPHTHMGYFLDGFGPAYFVQAQGQIMVAEADWTSRYSYHPELPHALETSRRDDKFIALLRDALDRFCDMKDEMLERARATGFFAGKPVEEIGIAREVANG